MSPNSSHSRRSSLPPSSTLRAPKWKSASFLSSQPATSSVTRVFAQPLQGSPLRPAIDQLPSVFPAEELRSMRSEGDVGSKRGRAASMLIGSSNASQDTLAVSERLRSHSLDKGEGVSNAPDSSLNVNPHITENVTPPSPLQPSPPSEQTVSEPVTPKLPESTSAPQPQVARSPPQRSSWFSSLSRSRGKQAAIASPPPNPQPTVLAPIDVSQPLMESPQSIQRTVTPAQTPVAIVSLSPEPISPQELYQNKTSASSGLPSAVPSIDDEVPALKVLPHGVESSVQPPQDKAKVVTRRASASGLNPSSSRFMLRIPLLGRPKTPLEEVIAHTGEGHPSPAPVDKAIEPSIVPDVIVSAPSSEGISEQASPQPQDGNTSATVSKDTESFVPKPDEVSSPTHDSPGVPASSSSWWSYVGWYGSTSAADLNGPNFQNDAPSDSTDPKQDPEVGSHAPTEPAPLAPEVPSPEKAASELPVPKEPELPQQPSQSDQKQTPSLFSAETGQASAWYSPWGWYAASPIAPSSSTALASTSPSESTDDTSHDSHQKTESEIVKEQALARDSEIASSIPDANNEAADAGTAASGTSHVSHMLQPANPIESTIASNRSGWASFFMSRTFVKSITDGEETKLHDHNGMEVMVIDEDDERGGRSSQTPTPTIPPTPVTKAVDIVSARPGDALRSAPQSVSASPNTRDAVQKFTKEREPRKSGPPAPPLTNSDSIKKETAKVSAVETRSPSPTPSKASATSPRVSPPNLVLPTWSDTFQTQPRSFIPSPPTPPPPQKSTIGKTLDFFSGVLFAGNENAAQGTVKEKGKERERDVLYSHFGADLPKALDVTGELFNPKVLNDKCRVVVIGVAGWSPGAVTRTIAGGLPSTSSKFVNMTCTALEQFEEEHNFKFKKITRVPLEGDGTVERKVEKVYTHLLSDDSWVEDLHSADVIFVAAHSQGCIVSTHLLDRLIREGHILTPRNLDIIATTAASIAPGGIAPVIQMASRAQRICCLSLCGIHLGPLRYMKTSSLLQPYIQYFENAAARELFEFQDTESDVSKRYVQALKTVMDHGTKMVYVASLNDQVVPIYSGLFIAASHPRILRALYIDGDAYHSSDFLSNLLVLLIRIMNSGLSDSGLLAHLSEATAGTLSGVGHSTAYEELATYTLAVNYLFLTTDGPDIRKDVVVEPFNAVNEQNDYEIPWSLRDLIADGRVAHFFASEFSQLRDAFDHWTPKTTILRDVKRKLQPIQRLSSIRGNSFGSRL